MNTSATKNKGLMVTILSISFLLMLRLTISPALAEIGKAFPGVSQEALMNMVSLASLVAIPFGFLAGVLANRFRTRTLLFVGLALYIVGGMGPMLTSDFTVILVCRALLGAGTGIFLPYAAGLIADFYTGQARDVMLGYQSTAVALGNIITAILAGVLATFSWRLSFLIYAFAIVTLVLVVLKLPEPQRTQPSGKQESGFNRGVVTVCVLIFFYAVIYFAIFGYLSFVVDSHKLGDAASTGLATMIMTVMSMVSGVLFARIIGLLRQFSAFVALLLNAVGFFLLSIATDMSLIFAGAAFIGLGFGLLMPYGTMKVTDAAPKSAATFANGLYMTFVNLGTAASPTILVTIGSVFGNPDGQFIYRVCAIVLVVAAVIAVGVAFVVNQRKPGAVPASSDKPAAA